MQPEGYTIEGSEDLVYSLRKALYGLKQVPRAWYSSIDQHFREQCFIRSEYEHTLYRKEQANGESLLLSQYVDDIIYTRSSIALINQFKTQMMENFEMSDLGELNYFLGLEVKQESDGIFIKQKNYIKNLLQKLNMKNCKLVMTPMGVNDRS